jgi:hypothetical protein
VVLNVDLGVLEDAVDAETGAEIERLDEKSAPST